MRKGARQSVRLAFVGLCLGMGPLLAACGQGTPPSAITSAQTIVPTPTPVGGVGTDPCTQPNAESATYLSANNIPAPSKAGFVFADQSASDGPGTSIDFATVSGCVQGSTPGHIQAFYTARMPAAGWKVSTNTAQPPCTDTPCWTRVVTSSDGNTITYGVMLQHVQHVQAGANDTTFDLRIVGVVESG